MSRPSSILGFDHSLGGSRSSGFTTGGRGFSREPGRDWAGIHDIQPRRLFPDLSRVAVQQVFVWMIDGDGARIPRMCGDPKFVSSQTADYLIGTGNFRLATFN